MKCIYDIFNTHVMINLITETSDPDSEVTGYMVDMSVQCRRCGMPFEFVGLEAGVSLTKPMTTVIQQEVHMPIRPANWTSKVLGSESTAVN